MPQPSWLSPKRTQLTSDSEDEHTLDPYIGKATSCYGATNVASDNQRWDESASRTLEASENAKDEKVLQRANQKEEEFAPSWASAASSNIEHSPSLAVDHGIDGNTSPFHEHVKGGAAGESGNLLSSKKVVSRGTGGKSKKTAEVDSNKLSWQYESDDDGGSGSGNQQHASDCNGNGSDIESGEQNHSPMPERRPPPLRPPPLRSASLKLSIGLNALTLLSATTLFVSTGLSLSYSLSPSTPQDVGFLALFEWLYLLTFTMTIIFNELGFLKGATVPVEDESTSSSSKKNKNKNKSKSKKPWRGADGTDSEEEGLLVDEHLKNAGQVSGASRLTSWFIRGYSYIFVGLLSNILYELLGSKEALKATSDFHLPFYVSVMNLVGSIGLMVLGLLYILASFCCLKSHSEKAAILYARRLERWQEFEEQGREEGRRFQKQQEGKKRKRRKNLD